MHGHSRDLKNDLKGGSDTGAPNRHAYQTSAISVAENNACVAAIDLGTNNCRMLMAEADGVGFRVVDSYSRVTRLGEGLSTSGALSKEAMDRTVDALVKCAEKMRRKGVQVSRHVATEACRRAHNCDELLERVQREAGIKLEIISADEEAVLAVKGCAALLDPAIPYALIFDIGGGSTEISLVKQGGGGTLTVLGYISLQLGVVTVSEDCGGGDLNERTYECVIDRVSDLIGPFDARHDISTLARAGQVQVLGTSGTVTTLGGMVLGLPRYDRDAVDGMTLQMGDLIRVSRELCAMTLKQRAAQPCIGWQRAELVLAGCAIVEAICNLWPTGQLTIADRGLREGMLLDMLGSVDAPTVKLGYR